MPDLLVVEDDFALGEFLREAFERDDIPFRMALDGEHALALASERWPAGVLLDLTLPGPLDGWQVWDRLLALSQGRPLRVLLFAASLDGDDLAQARQRSVWTILRKPASRVRLIEHARQVLAEAVASG